MLILFGACDDCNVLEVLSNGRACRENVHEQIPGLAALNFYAEILTRILFTSFALRLTEVALHLLVFAVASPVLATCGVVGPLVCDVSN